VTVEQRSSFDEQIQQQPQEQPAQVACAALAFLTRCLSQESIEKHRYMSQVYQHSKLADENEGKIQTLQTQLHSLQTKNSSLDKKIHELAALNTSYRVEQERFAADRKVLEEEIKKLNNLLEDQHSHVSVLKEELSKQYANNIRMKANMSKDNPTRTETHFNDGALRGDKFGSNFSPPDDAGSFTAETSPPSSDDSLTEVDKNRRSRGRGAIASRAPTRKKLETREVSSKSSWGRKSDKPRMRGESDLKSDHEERSDARSLLKRFIADSAK